MGVEPDRLNSSLTALSDAVYRNGMFSNGLSTIETDELHAYEEGINADSAMLYLNWGDPLTVERLMETVKAFDERIILPNPQGHLLFSSNWFGGNKVYREPNWQWQKPYSFPALHPAFLMGQYNADPTGRKLVTGLADSYRPRLHRRQGPLGAAQRDQLGHGQGAWRRAQQRLGRWRCDAHLLGGVALERRRQVPEGAGLPR